jgi:hypothetical protein
LKQLAASTSPRKSLFGATSMDVPAIAEDIQLLRVDPSILSHA